MYEKIISRYENNNAAVKNIVTEENPFRFNTFGKKTFKKVNIEYTVNGEEKSKEIVEKKYNGIDMTMMISGDKTFREFSFIDSEIYNEFKNYFYIPYLGKNDDEKIIYMENVSEELAEFGPPKTPEKEQMEILIRNLAEKDSKMTKNTCTLAKNYYDSTKNFSRIITGILTGNLDAETTELLNTSWKWFSDGLNRFVSENGEEVKTKLLAKYDTLNIEDEVKGMPEAYQHGDFYFANIGFRGTEAVVIDWESITFGPAGYDFVLLTAGMPPLPFAADYTKWYVEEYNKNAVNQITVEEFERNTEILFSHLYYTGGIVDAIKFGYSDNPRIPEEMKKGMLAELIDWINN